MIGGLLRVLVITLVMLVAALMLLPRGRDVAPNLSVATRLDAPRELPPVALIDQDGNPFALSQLAGRPTLVFFGFTNCPDVCPLTLAVLAQASQSLRAEDAALAPAVLFISVDADRDTPAQIKAYLERFDAGFIGATAAESALAPLIAALGVSVHKETRGDASYNVVHNGTVYVLDADVRWTALFGGSSHLPADIVNDYLALQGRRAAE
jgi:protein SCO1/2